MKVRLSAKQQSRTADRKSTVCRLQKVPPLLELRSLNLYFFHGLPSCYGLKISADLSQLDFPVAKPR